MMSDLYCVTKIVKSFEAQRTNPTIAVIVSMALCLGGNYHIPKFYEATHSQCMMIIIEDKTYRDGLFKLERNRQTCVIEKLNEMTMFTSVYLRKSTCGGLISTLPIRLLMEFYSFVVILTVSLFVCFCFLA